MAKKDSPLAYVTIVCCVIFGFFIIGLPLFVFLGEYMFNSRVTEEEKFSKIGAVMLVGPVVGYYVGKLIVAYKFK